MAEPSQQDVLALANILHDETVDLLGSLPAALAEAILRNPVFCSRWHGETEDVLAGLIPICYLVQKEDQQTTITKLRGKWIVKSGICYLTNNGKWTDHVYGICRDHYFPTAKAAYEAFQRAVDPKRPQPAGGRLIQVGVDPGQVK